MSLTPPQSLLTILVIALATLATRAIPFLLFPEGKPTPKYIVYLGKVLPCATMGMLVVYCVKSVSLTAWPNGLPELIAILAVGLVQYKWRNTLLSIASGTILYMVLIQVVFR